MNYGSQQEECKGKNTKWNVIKQDAVSLKTNCPFPEATIFDSRLLRKYTLQ